MYSWLFLSIYIVGFSLDVRFYPLYQVNVLNNGMFSYYDTNSYFKNVFFFFIKIFQECFNRLLVDSKNVSIYTCVYIYYIPQNSFIFLKKNMD